MTAILTAAGALVGGSRSIAWRNRIMGLNLHVVLLPGVVAETSGWLDFITAPLAAEVARLRGAAGDPNGLAASLQEAAEDLKAMAPDDPGRAEALQEFSRLGELAFPGFFLNAFPRSKVGDALGSTLVADASGKAMRTAIQELSEAEFLGLVADDAAVEQRWLSLLLVAPTELVAALKGGDVLSNWCPVILPQAGGAFLPPELTKEEAAAKWAGVVAKLLAIRRSPSRCMVVDAAGEAVLNAVKTRAEDAATRMGQAKWLPWPMTVCAKLAGILHTLNSDGAGDPGADKWADAQRFTEWLIDVQIRGVGGFQPTAWGLKRRFHPPRPDDLQRMRALIRKRQIGKYRELVRYLPKRPPGVWKQHFVEITGAQPLLTLQQKLAFVEADGADEACPTHPTCPARPTRPTSDTL